MEVKYDFYYECNKCKEKIGATFNNPTYGVEAIEEKKNNYVFHCVECFNKENGSLAQG